MKITHLPKLESQSLKNWYVAQLHELITKCLDGLSPRWNQTETSFSYDHILTINRMGYVDKESTIRFLIQSRMVFDDVEIVQKWCKNIKNNSINLFLFINFCFGLFSNVFSLIEEDKRSIKSIKQHNNITSFFEAILLSSFYSLSNYFSIITSLFLLSWCYWFDYCINIIMKIILFIHKITFVLKHWFFQWKWKLFKIMFYITQLIIKMLFIRRKLYVI